MSLRPVDVAPLSIIAAIVVRDAGAVAATARAVQNQLYGPERVVLIGGGRAGKDAATALGHPWHENVPQLLDGVDSAVTHLWLVTSGSLPRPDALDALATEAERVDAGVAGSKLLLESDPDRLASIGIATDLFDVPYVGLDPDEIDAGQYDVVRDVAALELDSLLIRRDLARGVAGLDRLLAPEAAAIDLCQRARMRGARIVVVPSSEVLVPDEPGGVPWEEDAGRIRAMLKAYSLLTLLWAIPVRFLIGAVEVVVSPFLGRWSLFRFVRAWAWNVVHLPSTLALRRTAHRGETLGDAELFRYQLRGSASLRGLSAEIGTRLRDRLTGGEGLDLSSIGAELRQPAFVVGAMAIGFALVSTRTLWSTGFPSVGFSLPLPDSGPAAVAAYAGGWNPAGFGSSEPLLPLIGAAGALQTALFGDSAAAAAVLVLASFLGGIWGMNRLLRRFGIEAAPALVAGIALVAGPASRSIGAATDVGTLVGIGVLPWATLAAMAPFPRGMRRRVGRVAGAAFATGLTAVASPSLLLVPLIAAVVWLAVRPGWDALRSLAIALSGAILAAPLLVPWITAADLASFLQSGSAYWAPGAVLAALVAVAVVCGLVASPGRLATVTAWGGLTAVVGGVIARSDGIGGGRQAQLAGMALAALGTAVVVGGLLDTVRRVDEVRGWRRAVGSIGAVAAGAVAISALLLVLPGRAGLPRDSLSASMRFAASTEGAASSRILLVGPAEDLPGESRLVRGASYRVVSAPRPALWEADLPEAVEIDDALQAGLEAVIDGDTFRAGEILAPFGIRWVIVVGDTPFESVFGSQLDLAPLDGLDLPTFANDAAMPVRAVTDDGIAWTSLGTAYEGPTDPSARVFIAETQSSRWGPSWVASGWGNEVSAAQGTAQVTPDRSRRSGAAAAAAWGLLLAGLAIWARRR